MEKYSIEEVCKKIKNYVKENGFDEKCEYIQEVIINSKNPRNIYEFAFVEGADIERLQDAILATENSKWITYFTSHIDGANIEKSENVILAKNDLYDMIQFLHFVKGANVKKFENYVINKGDDYSMEIFSKYIKTENSEKMSNKARQEKQNLTNLVDRLTKK